MFIFNHIFFFLVFPRDVLGRPGLVPVFFFFFVNNSLTALDQHEAMWQILTRNHRGMPSGETKRFPYVLRVNGNHSTATGLFHVEQPVFVLSHNCVCFFYG